MYSQDPSNIFLPSKRERFKTMIDMTSHGLFVVDKRHTDLSNEARRLSFNVKELGILTK